MIFRNLLPVSHRNCSPFYVFILLLYTELGIGLFFAKDLLLHILSWSFAPGHQEARSQNRKNNSISFIPLASFLSPLIRLFKNSVYHRRLFCPKEPCCYHPAAPVTPLNITNILGVCFFWRTAEMERMGKIV